MEVPPLRDTRPYTMPESRSVRRVALAVCASVALVASAAAQKPLDRSKPKQDPANDPYTEGGSEELMAAAGYESMGGFEFGPEGSTTETIDEFLNYLEIRWIETEHFELGIALPRIKVTGKERGKVRGELERLQAKLPSIEPTTRMLDPWLRAHVYAQRLEEFYDRFQEFLGVIDEDFANATPVWNMQGEYMGTGPHLGMSGKYEVFILPSEGSFVDFMSQKVGLTMKTSQRWCYTDRDTLAFIVHTDQGRMTVDEALHNHIVFSVAQNLALGYKHYSYELPIWLQEGIGHWFERDLNPRFNSFTASEGGAAKKIHKEDWEDPVEKMVNGDDAPSFASLIKIRTFAELEQDDHLAVWSIVDFLMQEHPDFLPKLLREIGGVMSESGYPDGSTVADLQRTCFKEELGMTYGAFEAAWKAWVMGDD